MGISLPKKQTQFTLHVTELARLAEVTPATVRHYSRAELLHPGREAENDYRCFSNSDVRRVKFIRQARELGLAIVDIKLILDTADNGNLPCKRVKSLVEQRLKKVRLRINDLKATEARMSQALTSWNSTFDHSSREAEFCPLIEKLHLVGPEPCEDTVSGVDRE